MTRDDNIKNLHLLSTEINECASLPCFNGGTCVDKLNSFECTCNSGFQGKHCESGSFHKKK